MFLQDSCAEFPAQQYRRGIEMNWEQFVGICRLCAEKMNGALRKLTGDPLCAAQARYYGQLQAKSQKRNGIEKADSARQLLEFLQRNRNWHV